MDSYGPFIARMKAQGATQKESSENVTRRNQVELIMNSPSRSDVTLNEEESTRPSIVSDTETFNKRRFLFLPDTEIEVGFYIHHDEKIYLATDKTTDPIYPQLFGENCNETFPIFKETILVDTGKVDAIGAPIYEYKDIYEDIPCVLETKVYSALSNSPIPLPTGAIIIKIPYDPGIETEIPINYTYTNRGSNFQVTELKYQYVVKEIGYVEIHLQREVKRSGHN